MNRRRQITLCCIFPILVYFRKLKPHSQQMKLRTEIDINAIESDSPADNKALRHLYRLYDEKCVISREDLHIGSILGKGHEGEFLIGQYGSLEVAVKTVTRYTDELCHFKSLLSELKILGFIGKHDHIVNLIGVCTKDFHKGYVYILYEYCANGTLKQTLSRSRKMSASSNSLKNNTLKIERIERWRQTFGYLYPSNYIKHAETVTMEDLALWSHQIASGMDYISRKQVIHGDLSAKNVWVNKKCAKIGGFGFSQELFDNSKDILEQHNFLPLKWMAPEAIRDKEFSTLSDVWSFGITLWEIYSLGRRPYPELNWKSESWTIIFNGYRMGRPNYASPVIFEIISECWNIQPNMRPTFKFLMDYFGEELRQLKCNFSVKTPLWNPSEFCYMEVPCIKDCFIRDHH